MHLPFNSGLCAVVLLLGAVPSAVVIGQPTVETKLVRDGAESQTAPAAFKLHAARF